MTGKPMTMGELRHITSLIPDDALVGITIQEDYLIPSGEYIRVSKHAALSEIVKSKNLKKRSVILLVGTIEAKHKEGE